MSTTDSQPTFQTEPRPNKIRGYSEIEKRFHREFGKKQTKITIHALSCAIAKHFGIESYHTNLNDDLLNSDPEAIPYLFAIYRYIHRGEADEQFFVGSLTPLVEECLICASILAVLSEQ